MVGWIPIPRRETSRRRRRRRDADAPKPNRTLGIFLVARTRARASSSSSPRNEPNRATLGRRHPYPRRFPSRARDERVVESFPAPTSRARGFPGAPERVDACEKKFFHPFRRSSSTIRRCVDDETTPNATPTRRHAFDDVAQFPSDAVTRHASRRRRQRERDIDRIHK